MAWTPTFETGGSSNGPSDNAQMSVWIQGQLQPINTSTEHYVQVATRYYLWVAGDFYSTQIKTNWTPDRFTISTEGSYGMSDWYYLANMHQGEAHKETGEASYIEGRYSVSHTIYAYTVTYDGDGGAYTNANGETMSKWINGVFKDQKYHIEDNFFIKNGYTFAGWYTGKNGTGTRWEPGTNYIWAVDASVTLYAYWVPNTFTITYDGDGGVYNGSTILNETVFYNQDYFIKENFFIKERYIFEGWYTGKNGTGTRWEPGTHYLWKIKNNVILYANWVLKGYSLAIAYCTNAPKKELHISQANWNISNDEIPFMVNSAGKRNTEYLVSDYNRTASLYDFNNFKLTRIGYSFTGEYKERKSGKILNNNSRQFSFKDLTDASTGKSVINLDNALSIWDMQWKPNIYTITFYNDKDRTYYEQKITYNTRYQLLPNTFNHPEFIFQGWEDIDTKQFYANNQTGIWNISRNVTLIAKWVPKPKKIIKYHLSDEKIVYETVFLEQQYTIKTFKKQKRGKILDSWQNASHQIFNINDKILAQTTESLDLYPIWKPIIIKFNYFDQNQLLYSTQCNYDDNINAYDATDLSIIGWSHNKDGTGYRIQKKSLIQWSQLDIKEEPVCSYDLYAIKDKNHKHKIRIKNKNSQETNDILRPQTKGKLLTSYNFNTSLSSYNIQDTLIKDIPIIRKGSLKPSSTLGHKNDIYLREI